ncbi:L-lactate permease [uncultured Veillonella sp.]|uniref:L-lactate permease n=1 Tax=uncultured Veillonella sp. TaxID=159268 RepID=UPI002614F76F|nr:L-lactate permease [uncultured Veillonella sp.]
MTIIYALLPLVWLVLSLTVLKMSAWKACSMAAFMTFIIAILPLGKSVPIMLSGALEGVALAIWPILLVITAAIFTYNLVVHTKAMETIKLLLSSVSSDKRILALLLAWGFGAFMEGMAGFGTSVAIPAAMMVALGFNPLKSILVCLIANSVQTTFGSVAIPVTTLASLTSLDAGTLGTFISIQLLLPNLAAPFFVVAIIGDGIKAIKGVFTITLLAGLSLAIPELLINALIGPELSVMIPSLLIMAVIIWGAKRFPPRNPVYEVSIQHQTISTKDAVLAALPFILIMVLLILTSQVVPPIYGPLSSIKTTVPIYMGDGAKPYTFTWLATPGTMIFIAAILGGFIQKAKASEMLVILKHTMNDLKFTYITIIAVVVTAKLMTYAGLTDDIANALIAITGSYYPLATPLVGALGSFATGSSTNANVLFGPLQLSVAQTLAPDLKELPLWLSAINSGASGIGKMFSPQSIAIAIGAVAPALDEYIKNNKLNNESAYALRRGIQADVIMIAIIKYFLIFIAAFSIISYFGIAWIDTILALK